MIFKTVRCIIKSNDKYLLAVHNNIRPETIGKWGLVGGHIEQGELFEITAIREVREELNLELERLTEVGNYSYDNSFHKVFGVDYTDQFNNSPNIRYDKNEILTLDWFSYTDIQALQENNKLHTGFEFEAIQDFEQLEIHNAYNLTRNVVYSLYS